jgi:hypothetical protein
VDHDDGLTTTGCVVKKFLISIWLEDTIFTLVCIDMFFVFFFNCWSLDYTGPTCFMLLLYSAIFEHLLRLFVLVLFCTIESFW